MSLSTSRCLNLPELVIHIASHLSNPADISYLSRCDRLFYELVTPLLYRNIRISIRDISAIAYVFKTNPHFVRLCHTLLVLDHLKGESVTVSLEKFQILCEQLIVVLKTLGDKGTLKVFSWCVNRGSYVMPMTVPTDFWHALGKVSGTLEELDVLTWRGEKLWTAVCAAEYPKLRALRLWLQDAHGWDCSALQGMLNGLQQLEVLHLNLPLCCGPSGLDLSSTHPRLRTFHLSTELVSGPAAHFLQRHPTIEHLSIEYANGLVLDPADLPKLKALSVDQSAILQAPALLGPGTRRPITHLRLSGMPYLTTPLCFELVESVASTLRHLELQWYVDGFRVSIPTFGDLLRAAPQLVELRITADSSNTYPPPQPLNAEDLSRFLLSIHGTTNIAVLHLIDPNGDCLPKSRLNDVGAVPESLMYLSWSVQSQPLTYRFESRNGKVVAIETKLPCTAETMLV